METASLLLLCSLGRAADIAEDVTIQSSKDGTAQRALFYAPPHTAGRLVPLLVFLHSWSTDYKTAGGWNEVLDESSRRGWVVIAPNFRGANDHPGACGSDLAVADVLDSVAYAKQRSSIDPQRTYLLGSSGGGYMALLMAVRAPATWSAISVWVPITNLATWHEFSKAANSQYYRMMEQCFGGPPDVERGREYRRRSPLFSLGNAKGIPIHIDSGIQDGHGKNAVPLRQSLEAFNALAIANGQDGKSLSETEVDAMTKGAKIPGSLAGERQDDPARQHKIFFRRSAGPVTLTIFDAGHTVDVRTGIRYFE